MFSWDPAACLAPPSKAFTQSSSISGSTTTLPACRCSSSPKDSPKLHPRFSGDCWPDSRRLLCRDVWFHARGENAPASGTAAGDIQHLRKHSNFNLICVFDIAQCTQDTVTIFIITGCLCGVPTISVSRHRWCYDIILGKNIYFTISEFVQNPLIVYIYYHHYLCEFDRTGLAIYNWEVLDSAV